MSSFTISASFRIVISSLLPMLKTSPIALGSLTSFMRQPTTSPMYVKLRDCVPSPKTVIGSFASAWRTNDGSTIPY